VVAVSRAASSTPEFLESVYPILHKLLSAYAPPFKSVEGTVRGKKDLHLVTPKAIAISGIYENKPKPAGMASIILQKEYRGFYYTPLYLSPGLKKNLSPSLTRLLKGKTCFHIKKVDGDLLQDLNAALQLGLSFFQERGWV